MEAGEPVAYTVSNLLMLRSLIQQIVYILCPTLHEHYTEIAPPVKL